MKTKLLSASLFFLFASNLYGETVSVNKSSVIDRPLSEVQKIILAFDKKCENGCLYEVKTLKDSKILEKTDDQLLIWTSIVDVVPIQTYKFVDISKGEDGSIHIRMHYPEADQVAAMQEKYTLPHKTSLDVDTQDFVLKEVHGRGDALQTEIQYSGEFAGALLKGFALTLVKKRFNEQADAMFQQLKTAPLPDARPRFVPTYYGDIKPIIDAHCVGCHSKGGQAPFVLDTYAAVKPKAAWIAQVTQAKIMPPWGANPVQGHELKYDISLSAEKIQKIDDWVKGGRLEGDALHPGLDIDLPKPTLNTVDKSFSMKESWKTNAGEQDEYRCFPVTVDGDEPFYVTGYRLQHDNSAYVHHAFVYAFDPEYAEQAQEMENLDPAYGYPCLVSPTPPEYYGVPVRTVAVSGLQGYEFTFGEDKGLLIRPGTTLIFQMHYSKAMADHHHGQAPASDISRTTIHLQTSKAVSKPVENGYLVDLKWLEPGVMKLPANQKDISYSYSEVASQMPSLLATVGNMKLDKGFYINAVFPHQHLLARGMRVWLEHSDGQNELIFDNFDRYSFHFQSMFPFENPIFVQGSDKLRVTCYWDNSPENQPDLGHGKPSPIDVYWGEETKDEMCVATVMLYEP